MAYGLSNGHVTDDVTWPPKMLWDSTVGYPSDSLVSCFVYMTVYTVTWTLPADRGSVEEYPRRPYVEVVERRRIWSRGADEQLIFHPQNSTHVVLTGKLLQVEHKQQVNYASNHRPNQQTVHVRLTRFSFRFQLNRYRMPTWFLNALIVPELTHGAGKTVPIIIDY